MSSDIYNNFDYSDNLVSVITTFDHHYYDDGGFLQAVSASSFASSPPEDLRLPPIQDPPLYFQEPPAFPSDCAGYGDAKEGSMQRSYSSNCCLDEDGGGNGGGKFDLGGGGGSDQRLVRSTGDLQRRIKSYALGEVVVVRAAERYSAEERKERIQKYRAKRNLRNFNKTIKYACRKTLADSRPRIRGRFARNDDVTAVATPPLTRHHDIDINSSSNLWVEVTEEEQHINQLYGWVKGEGEDDITRTSFFLPQNYYY